ncbi:DUF420 domain-containing protein [Mechercharimyces sp. CAU 1602]|uniref:DUF420 domain-containing protein n=1 Tax=Mechercharimyces sp. CAU 1602 TaxID=2973933 RepID=UPI00216284C0|nr:DUF420 domain-containing protein [Mechercharimyces sp. CAU 1602]MCS1350725.1 DUF420 domain-containing protein [Mechercharimyces sp. CAU 1602]
MVEKPKGLQNTSTATKVIIGLSLLINAIIALFFVMPKTDQFNHLDLTFLPMMNAIFNSFTFVFLVVALIMIKQKNIMWHRRFILAAFTSTSFFLVTYLIYHGLAESTSFGGEGPIRYVYFILLITHIFLAAIIVPLALFSIYFGWKMDVPRHRKIARWTMPIWLYVSISGPIVYLMISPYY